MKINYEYRKGIFFLRLFGILNKENYLKEDKNIMNIINNNKFKYIVINTNYLDKVDFSGLKYLIKLYYITKENNGNLVLCDKYQVLNKLFNNSIPVIKSEIEVL